MLLKIEPSEITPFLYNIFFGLGGWVGGDSPPPSHLATPLPSTPTNPKYQSKHRGANDVENQLNGEIGRFKKIRYEKIRMQAKREVFSQMNQFQDYGFV